MAEWAGYFNLSLSRQGSNKPKRKSGGDHRPALLSQCAGFFNYVILTIHISDIGEAAGGWWKTK